MKKIKLIYTIIFVLAVLFSCNKKEIVTENKKDNITITD